MKIRSLLTAICVLATANVVSAQPFAYIANSGTKNVTIIDTASNTEASGSPVALPDVLPSVHPYAYGVAVSASGQYVYVGLQDTNEVAVIDAARKTVVKRIGLGTDSPGGLAVNAAETRLYVASNKSNTLLVIDVTGAGATEIARVAVEDASVSNPEGVVLSPDGTKAYVANSFTGTVAVVALDEANNTYTRSSLINVGSKPMGLAINSTGAKLYVADYNGVASVVNTATSAVTALPVGSGNLTVAVTPDNSKIFAPSYALDKYYVIDGSADTVGGSPTTSASAPWGSAVNPAGTALYLPMNLSDNVKVYNTSTNALSATVALPAGAKPTSVGNFVGPALPYTITAEAQTNCTILPAGTVPVNAKGRSFSVSATSGGCRIYTGSGITACTPALTGTSTDQGMGSTYTFSNLTANDRICIVNQAGTFYTLSGSWTTAVSGAGLVSTPAGINVLSKSAQFISGTSVSLTVADSANTQVLAGSWTGDCAGTVGQTCTVTMSANRTFGATIVPKAAGGSGPIYDGTNYYQTLEAATTGAANGATIKISTAFTTGGATTGTAGNIVTLSGGWDATFATQTVPAPSMGALTITNVGVIANNLTL